VSAHLQKFKHQSFFQLNIEELEAQIMDRMSDIASFVATSVIESDANVAMEGYLTELLEFNTSMAMEAFDAKKAMQDAGVAIKRFIEGAKRRVLEMIGNIIRRIGEMMAAQGC